MQRRCLPSSATTGSRSRSIEPDLQRFIVELLRDRQGTLARNIVAGDPSV
jgi:hypothetical protein